MQHSRYQEDIPFWMHLAQLHHGRILELGCGTGRVLIPLAEAGYPVFGLDQDSQMLQFLKEHSGRLINLPVFCADMCRVSLAGQFSLIILPCNTYSTLSREQRFALLNGMLNHLQPDGLFAVSLPNPTLIASLPQIGEPDLEDVLICPVDQNPIQISSSWIRDGESFTLHYQYDHLFPNGTVNHYHIEQKHWLLDPAQVCSEFHQARFSDLTLFGDFDKSSFQSRSPQMIILAHR